MVQGSAWDVVARKRLSENSSKIPYGFFIRN